MIKKKKTSFFVICLLLTTFLVSLSSGANVEENSLPTEVKNSILTPVSEEGREYWALMVAVGVYKDHPKENRPTMLEVIDDLHGTLVKSDWWSEDHIKLIKGSQGTFLNIIQGLKWLNRNVDDNDVSLVYITTHGDSLYFRNETFGLNFPIDLPPFDEPDHSDEILLTYTGFSNPLTNIWDDLLNFYLSRLNSPGVCLIVDSCHSGGFNDSPYWWSNILGKHSEGISFSKVWMENMKEEMSSSGRVVLMSCREDRLSYGSLFSDYIDDGLRGEADYNNDEVVTAEELFDYVEDKNYIWGQQPTIYDGYPDNLPLIKI